KGSRAGAHVRIFAGRMKSMTGYGRGECAQDGFKVTVELSSVNRKQSEISVYLPRDLEALESRVRDEVNRQISRGRLTVRFSLHAADGSLPGRVRLNAPLAKAYTRELNRLAKELKLAGPVTLDLVVRAPGVLQADDEVTDAEAFWPAVEKALRKGLAALVQMREREGAHLLKDLQKRVGIIRRSVERVQKQAPEVLKRYQEQLRERVRNAGLEMPAVDDERLLKEIVYFADRSDISEEVTRLQSHFQQFEDCVESKQPVGRTLDFLTQEMNREVNTIGSKANDSLISREVVVLKAELEKFREQVQNVE
ncbi:MAG TPA: YicC/YloC family endoribonuclease, partial [Verrucomicrobiae bacterium]|nr:YicC/YloC family endoribonuclease [Verrucomicrobiae bacterium]